jgi:hypothetical protein
MWEGFETFAVSNKEHPSYGKKIVNGWKKPRPPLHLGHGLAGISS